MNEFYAWIWLIIALVMIVIELITIGNLITIWFAIGAAAAFITHLAFPNLILELIAFVTISCISLFAIRPLATKALRGNTVPTNADRIIGQQVTLETAVTETTWGTANIYGTVWSVTSFNHQPMAKGQRVEVIAIEGVKLIVKEIH